VPEKTVTRSFRINESAFLALEEEAKKRGRASTTIMNCAKVMRANTIDSCDEEPALVIVVVVAAGELDF
jgi:hypothetical protein